MPDDALLEKIREMPQKGRSASGEEVASMLGAYLLRVIFKAKWAAAGHPVFAEEKPTQRVTDSVKDPLESSSWCRDTLIVRVMGQCLVLIFAAVVVLVMELILTRFSHVGPDQLRFGDVVHIRVLWLAGPIRFGDGAQS